ncbi:MAG: DUF6893 family small protein [Solirubrobacteraceae bacterium]
MKEITIKPSVQVILFLGALGATGAAIAAQLPEMQRYLKIRAM